MENCDNIEYSGADDMGILSGSINSVECNSLSNRVNDLDLLEANSLHASGEFYKQMLMYYIKNEKHEKD